MDAKSEIVLTYLLESSSSSDDDEIYEALLRRNKLPRVNNFIENVIHQYSETDFKKNLRLSRKSATYIIERYSASSLTRKYQGGRPQSTVEEQVISFLWFAGNKTTFREVANLFDMSISNLHKSFKKVLNFLVNEMAPEVIKFPKSELEKEIISKEFEKISGFPNVIGCVDGSYISVRKPKHKIRSTYANRHDTLSITLQAICDSKLRFLDVFTGVPCKIHDSRVLKLSFIGKDLNNLCFPKYHILGDSAYPLREYLLTPYRDYGNLSEPEKNYNEKFFPIRVKIENAFGVLKGRFRQLLRLDFHDVVTMSQFVIAACVLHNICIDNEDIFEEELSCNVPNVPSENFDDDRRDRILTQLGQMKRNKIKTLLYN